MTRRPGLRRTNLLAGGRRRRLQSRQAGRLSAPRTLLFLRLLIPRIEIELGCLLLLWPIIGGRRPAGNAGALFDLQEAVADIAVNTAGRAQNQKTLDVELFKHFA